MTLKTPARAAHMLIAIATVAAALTTGLPAQASDDECRSVPRSEWRPEADAIAAVKAQGYEVRQFEIDDGCYEIYAIGKAGERVKLYLDPGSLAIVRTKSGS